MVYRAAAAPARPAALEARAMNFKWAGPIGLLAALVIGEQHQGTIDAKPA
jgi:hypothetical protein